MLGNWSFGDYHKEEACKLAWHFLTQVLGIEPRRLYITYFDGNGVDGEGGGGTHNGNNNKVFEPDLETRDIWKRIGVPDSHLLPFDAASNFWRLGPIGPCGPCTEIHVDMNDEKEHPPTDEGKEIARRLLVNTDDPSMVELWNLVFMQYNRQPDGSLVPLPIGNVVDTGLGLERLCALMQGCQSAYDTDLFWPLIGRISELSPTKPVYRGRLDPHDIDGVDTAFRIVADHIRTLVITLAEGVRITNSKKYARKLKAMFKRTALVAHEKLGVRRGALADLVPLVVEQLGDAHPNLRRNQQQVMDKVRAEETRMWAQRDAGRARLADIIEGLPADAISFSGKHAFELAKVYRLELDLIGEAAAQRGLEVNEEEFRELTEKWRRNTHTTAATTSE